MMKTLPLYFAVGLLAGVLGVVVACQDQTNPTLPATPINETPGEEEVDSGYHPIGEPVDAAKEASAGKDAASEGGLGQCASTFGDKLTVGFGRIDGIVYAVQKPSDTQCVFPNDDHVIVQVLMGGAVYRMVVNVLSTGTDPKIRYTTTNHALPAPAFADGWHTGATVKLDYPTDLNLHNAAFAPFSLDELVTKLVAEVKVGDPISVYAQCGTGRPESAHLIHRNTNSQKDGAIVVKPTSANPKFLAFHFDEQVF